MRIGADKPKHRLENGVETPAEQPAVSVLSVQRRVGALRSHHKIVNTARAEAPTQEGDVPEVNIDNQGPRTRSVHQALIKGFPVVGPLQRDLDRSRPTGDNVIAEIQGVIAAAIVDEHELPVSLADNLVEMGSKLLRHRHQ